MYSVLAAIHVIVSLVLIVIVLMQSQQSMNLSGMFGGASQSALGSQPQSVLSKATTVLAIVFMVVSLVFSLVPRSEQSILSPGNLPTGSQQPAPSSQQQSNQSQPGQPQAPSPANQGQQSPSGSPAQSQ